MKDPWHPPVCRWLRNGAVGGGLLSSELDVWLRHQKIFADLPGKIVVDFAVARDAGGLVGGAIHVDRVVATLAQQLAVVLFEMSNQVSALQALTFSGSRITSGPKASS